ncbi:MAG TPA: molybdenum cofactor biosynthesis protein MoaE [Candidatus Polarisedimenticolia bacterium]|nr:molybdenum cofactor biosynthesis protein MoaE [Candidatus Polarisedimenticolia bacterium]
MYRIVSEPIDIAELLTFVSAPEIGGIVTFCGTVRKQNAGRAVLAVEYHAYPAMAEKAMRAIGGEVLRGYGVRRVGMAHRVGRLNVGEVSVVIAVGAPHRHEALGATAYAIERLKQVVPIWKKEFYEDGSAWLEPQASSEMGS